MFTIDWIRCSRSAGTRRIKDETPKRGTTDFSAGTEKMAVFRDFIPSKRR
jgi:hypothetical protein